MLDSPADVEIETVLFKPLTMPCVTVRERSFPSGSPMAMTDSPVLRADELPKLAVFVTCLSLISKTAKSVRESLPTSLAVTSVPSYNDTLREEAPSTTWLFVMIYALPFAFLKITPEPNPVSASSPDEFEFESELDPNPNKSELLCCFCRLVIPTIAGEMSSTIFEMLLAFADELFADLLLPESEDVCLTVTDDVS